MGSYTNLHANLQKLFIYTCRDFTLCHDHSAFAVMLHACVCDSASVTVVCNHDGAVTDSMRLTAKITARGNHRHMNLCVW